MTEIHVSLLNEGSICFRPVNATRVDKNVYKIDESSEFDPSDEKWEFEPGDIVVVEERVLRGDFNIPTKCLVAVKLWQEKL